MTAVQPLPMLCARGCCSQAVTVVSGLAVCVDCYALRDAWQGQP